MGAPCSNSCVAPIQDDQLGVLIGQQLRLLNTVSNWLLSGCCQVMLPMCNQNCGRTLIKKFLFEYQWPFQPFAYTPITSEFFPLSFARCLPPLFLSTREGWDDYHFRKVKGQRGFSSGRLISWPWHSLSTALSLLQNWRDLQAMKECE